MTNQQSTSAHSDSAQMWHNLPRPIIGLAPMDGVSDQPFRFIQKKYGNPMVVVTEFTSVEGMCMGNLRLLRDFLFDETQRPVVAQIYGHTPDYFRQTAILLCQLGFDAIDINMGCPATNIANSGSGAGLIRTPNIAQELVYATKAGVKEWLNGQTVRDCPNISEEIRLEVEARHAALTPEYQQRRKLPVTVKTRIGYDEPDVESWVSTLLETDPAVICLHGRTLDQKYRGLADWDEIQKAVKVAEGTRTLILGNGDVQSRADALERVERYGVDGVLIGRASFGNPFVFHMDRKRFDDNGQPESLDHVAHLFEIALEHAQLYEDTFSHYPKYQFQPMRKHLSWYSMGVPGARKVRNQLVHTHSAADAERILKEIIPASEKVLAA